MSSQSSMMARNLTGVSSSTPSGVSSSTPSQGGSCLNVLMGKKAASQAMEPDMLGENGDPCHSDLGYYSSLHEQLISDTLGLKQQLVGNEESMITQIVDASWPKVVYGLNSMSKVDRQTQIILLFKLCFFARAIRCQGGRSRVQFYVLFNKLYTEFPEETLAVTKLIPHYGCFQDVDFLITKFEKDMSMYQTLLQVYRDAITCDLERLLGVPFVSLTLNDLLEKVKTLNAQLKKMNNTELLKFVCNLPEGQFSLAGKWVKREGKKNSQHRDDLIRLLFGYPKSSSKKTMDFGRMLLRNIATVLSQCLNVVEHNMTEATSRGWADIQMKNVPSKATTNYSKALNNLTKSGCERSQREDRRQCAQNVLKQIMEGKLNGAQQDMQKLADLIWSKLNDMRIAEVEKTLINAQWKKMVEFVNQLITDTIEKDQKLRDDAISNGDVPPEPIRDPRAVMPVVDVSGSMSSAGVMHYAIAIGIIAATISSIPGKLITFSENPEVFSFDPQADIFDVFRLVKQCSWGMSTNLDSTYRLLLNEMVTAKNAGHQISTDFSLMIVTDGQFNSMVNLSSRGERRDYHTRSSNLDSFDSFQVRQEKAFTDAGFGVPLVVYWNMALSKPGFPVQSSTTGVKLVAGFSQTVMVEVMTGDYKTTIDEATGAVKVSVTPLESFIKTMNHDSLDLVQKTLIDFWNHKFDSPSIHLMPPAPPASDEEDEIIRDLEEKIQLAKKKKILELQSKLEQLESSV
jgi:hypothetical protein